MNDEYYQPKMHWANNNDDEYEEETLDDGDLPSLKRVNSAGNNWREMAAISHAGTTTTNARGGDHHYDEEEDDSYLNGDDIGVETGYNNRGGGAGPSPSAVAATAAATAALVTPTAGAAPTTDQLKVAGFWSQLDDNDATSCEDDDSNNDANGGDDDDEMPNDERNWRRRSKSPQQRNRGAMSPASRSTTASGRGSRRVGFADQQQQQNNNDDGDSIGLDLVGRNYNNNDEDDDSLIKQQQQQRQHQRGSSEGNKTSSPNNNWNLLEKAACFNANQGDEDDDTLNMNTTANSNKNRSSSRRGGRTNEMEETYETDEQSLDQTFQTFDTGTRTGGGTTTRVDGDDDDEYGVLACITLALATVCGYEAATAAYGGNKSTDGASTTNGRTESANRKRALEIIEQRRRRAAAAGGIDSDASSVGSDTIDAVMAELAAADAAANDGDERSLEDVAVELQYNPTATVDSNGIPMSPPMSPGGSDSGALSPTTKKKKKSLRKILHLPKITSKRKIRVQEDDMAEEVRRKTLVTTTTRSGFANEDGTKSRVTDYLSSLTFEQEILGDDDDDDHQLDTPGAGANQEAAAANTKADGNDDQQDTANKNGSPINESMYDDEELQSEAAGWSTNKKNDYLRQLAARAKMEYAAKAGSSAARDGEDQEGEDDDKQGTSSSGMALGAAAAALAVGAGAAALAAANAADSRDDDDDYTANDTVGRSTTMETTDQQDLEGEDDETLLEEEAEQEEESTLGSIKQNDTGVPTSLKGSSYYNADYNSFSPTEKRQFLRLLNQGMSPSDIAKSIAMERNGTPIVEEEEDEAQIGEEEEEVDENERSSTYPVNESMPSLISEKDPPGDILLGASGESAELSTEPQQYAPEGATAAISKSDQAQDTSEDKSGSGRGKYALAAIPLVPAIVRAKRRKSKQQDQQQSNAVMPELQDAPDNVPTSTTAYVDERASPAPEADGLLSSGIEYYDAKGRGFDRSEHESDNGDDDGYYDSVLLDSTPAQHSSKGKARRGKLLGAGVASGLAAKVARRDRNKYKSVNTSSSVPIESRALPSSPAASAISSPFNDDARSDFSAKSPRNHLSSAFSFMKKSKGGSNFEKLDSDLALDQVAPSRSLEINGTPSWLLPRDDEMPQDDEEDEKEEAIIPDEKDDVDVEMEEELMQDDEDAGEQQWSPAMSPEMASVSRKRNVVTPTVEADATPGSSYASPQESAVVSPQESKFLSPGSATLSPTSPQDTVFSVEDNIEEAETPGQQQDEVEATDPRNTLARAIPSPAESSSQYAETASANIAKHAALTPTDEIDNVSLVSDSHSYTSGYTHGSSWTGVSKSHRKRHKGAANKRLLQAKAAEDTAGPKTKGWLGSIRDVASTQGQVWDPEKGWTDYTEPEVHGHHDIDTRSIGNLHLSMPKKRASPKQKPEIPVLNEPVQDRGIHQNDPKSVDFPAEWAQGRDNMVSSEALVVSSVVNANEKKYDGIEEDDDTVFDAMTVTSINTAAEATVYSSSAAPARRSAPKHRPTDRRKMTSASQNTDKPIGWKQSMEDATAKVGTGRHWDYQRGWVNDDDTMDDDVSQLTRSTMERRMSPGNSTTDNTASPAAFESQASPPVQENSDAVQRSHISQYDVSPGAATDDSLESSHLSLVEEEAIDATNSGLSEATDEIMDGVARGSDKEIEQRYISEASSKYDAPPTDHVSSNITSQHTIEPTQRSIGVPSLMRVDSGSDSGSDKENSEADPASSNGAPSQKPPLAASTTKRSLNQWLENANNNTQSKTLNESNEAAMSRTMGSDEVAAGLTESNDSSSSQLRLNEENLSHFSNRDDPFGVDNDDDDNVQFRAQEIKVVKEKMNDADSDLFEIPAVTESYKNKIAMSKANENAPAIELFESNESSDSTSWNQQPAPSEEDRSVSSRARAWMSSMEKRSMAGESAEGDLDSNLPQVNKTRADKGDGAMSNSVVSSGSSYIGSRNAKKANSWIRSNKELENVDEQKVVAKTVEEQSINPVNPSRSTADIGSLRSKFETEDKPVVEKEEAKPVFVTADTAIENDVFFRSTAMGIRLKRGDDGCVRVVSVTEASPGSSIVRDGLIEPDDMIVEAAGVDLRSPISNSQWGETVTQIRNAPRPMKFVVAGGPRRTKEDTTDQKTDAPAKFVMESRLSKSPEGQQVLQTLSEKRNQGQGNSMAPTPIHRVNTSSRTSAAGTDKSVDSTKNDETTDQPKESFFQRMAACAAPVKAGCAAPILSDQGNDDGSHVPMAHLQFLRTNPTIARVTNAAQRRYPAMCGRPDTIFEEPGDDERERRNHHMAYSMSRSGSAASSTYGGSHTIGSRTYDTYEGGTFSTFDDGTKVTTQGSLGSGTAGENTAFLEKLALNTAVASKPKRSQQITNNTILQKLGKTAYVGSSASNASSQDDEVGWPGADELEYSKDTIDNASTYSSSTYQSSKKDTARQAELLAAAKVEDMMNDLNNVDPDSQSEI